MYRRRKKSQQGKKKKPGFPPSPSPLAQGLDPPLNIMGFLTPGSIIAIA